MRSARPFAARAVVAVLAIAAAAGCTSAPSDAPRAVVASTDVWGSVAQAVAGGDPAVTSLVSGAAADPHSFDPSASDAAAISDAALVVFNGGGYDPWVSRVLENRSEVPTVEAYALLDAAALGEPEPANEHVFYELNTAKAVADQVADRLSQGAPERSGEYRSRAAEFGRRAEEILQSQRAIATAAPNASVIATEPVAHYLLRAAGVTDKTPPGYAGAVEQDTDPAPADVAAILDLLGRRDVSALLYNDQTVTEVSKKIAAAAKAAGIPVVVVSETLPAGKDYLGWQADTTEALAAALREDR